jgi:hypothetical protein
MRVDGTAVAIFDKIVFGASPGVGTPVAADTVDFFVPAGAEVYGLAFQMDDSDSGAALVFGVGYRAVDPANATVLPTNNTYFAAAGQTTAQAGGRLTCAFKPIKFEVDAYIQLLVGTGGTTVGNPEWHMILECNQKGPK